MMKENPPDVIRKRIDDAKKKLLLPNLKSFVRSNVIKVLNFWEKNFDQYSEIH